jgi:hypothetical protein
LPQVPRPRPAFCQRDEASRAPPEFESPAGMRSNSPHSA